MESQAGAIPYQYWVIEQGNATLTEGGVIEETLLSLYVNGQELATLMCSPVDQEALALGFLYNEGVIDSPNEVGVIRANTPRTTVDVLLTRAEFDPPRRMVLTSGCGGGITLQHLSEHYPPLHSTLTIDPQVIIDRMGDLQGEAHLYNAVRGVHTSILATPEAVLVGAEDVGRHNTIDKIAGKALQGGIDTRDRIMLSSGRISSEMMGKARRMGVPIVASRTAPTSISVNLAQAWNICVIGYVRRGGMRVYTHPERVGLG
ncbi:MAG: formate dehydrogenase accessory sulfurtransferase FdhD [Anaerolineales bacterium]|nr:formate dehydrogenase accessory sulfurtransferase FdhD [Anaerolineales bacterium]